MPDVFTAPKDPTSPRLRGASEENSSNPVSDIGVSTVEAQEFKKHHFHHPFRSWMYKPHWVNFETQQKEEKIILLLRRHPITNVPWLLVVLLMSLAPLVLPGFPIIAFLPVNFQLVAILAWYLITFAFALENFLIWFFNVGIITSKRLVDIDFLNLLIKEVSDAELSQVQDVDYKMNGAVRAIFDYGDVFVQTASEKPNIEFLAIPKPERVVKILQEVREKRRG